MKGSSVPPDDETLRRSGNSKKKSSLKKSSVAAATENAPIEEQLAKAKEQIAQEKAGKRKLFHSLVKLANELRRTKNETKPVMELHEYAERNWHEGGMWRAPEVLPGVQTTAQKMARTREAISLSDLFFNLIIVTAFTRVGISITNQGFLDARSLLYFGVFWTVWSKEASYSTRFDTTDLSAQMETLFTCFAVLFASLSVQQPLQSTDGTRIMMMAAAVALLHCLLHVRVALTNSSQQGTNPLASHVTHYAVYQIVLTAAESLVWLTGIFVLPVDWPYRWCIFMVGLLLALRVPRAFLANDFHGACSKRGVLFILLLGFLLQQIVVIASEFYEYMTPTLQHYAFIGAACLMFFCIKLLYVDDSSDTLAEDHALLVNRWAGFFFNVGQFCLLLSTTVMGSGLNLLTHDYLAATAALPGPAKTLVCGGFSAVLLSMFFIKSMHLKRVPTDPRNQALFIAAYIIQSIVLLAVVGLSAAMALGWTGRLLEALMQNDITLLFSLSLAALFVLIMSWLDEGVELVLYESAEDSRSFRIHPFGFWWFLKPDVSDEELVDAMVDSARQSTTSRSSLSVLSPLLGSSIADIRQIREQMGASVSYQSISTGEGPGVV